MSMIRSIRRNGLNPRRVAVAKMVAKLQAIEPDAKKLRANLPEILEQVAKQRTVETFEPAKKI